MLQSNRNGAEYEHKVLSLSRDAEKPDAYQLVPGSQFRKLVTDLALTKGMTEVGGATDRIIPCDMMDSLSL